MSVDNVIEWVVSVSARSNPLGENWRMSHRGHKDDE